MPRSSSQDLSSAAAHRLPRIRKAHAVAAFLSQVDRSAALRLFPELILAGLDTAMAYKEAAYTAAEILVACRAGGRQTTKLSLLLLQLLEVCNITKYEATPIDCLDHLLSTMWRTWK